MNNYTSSRFVQIVLFCALVAVGLSVTGCDSSGSNSDGTPDWVGDWEAVSVSGEDSDIDLSTARVFYSLEEDQAELIFFSEPESTCFSETDDIVSVDGNVLTVEDRDDGDQEKIQVDVSDGGNTLTLTAPEDSIDAEIVTESIDSDPRELVDCSN